MAIARKLRLAFFLLMASVVPGGLGCDDPPPGDPPLPENAIPIGLLLSDTASASNSRRAVLMAIDAANQAGGIDGRPVGALAQALPADLLQTEQAARALVDAGVAVTIGPDDFKPLPLLLNPLGGRTMLMPSFTTFDYARFKGLAWFEMGPRPSRFACELVSRYQADGHRTALQIVSPDGYSNQLSWEVALQYAIPRFVLPPNPTAETMQSLTEALAGADAYLLMTSPAAAASLINTLGAAGKLGDPARWYLSPTLHTSAFFQSIPGRAMLGAGGVAPGRVAGASAFRARFLARWREEPLDDAYAYYDAGAIAVLAIQRALRNEAAIPRGMGLASHVIGVTRPAGQPVGWDEIDRGLELLRQGREVQYLGVNGELQFDDYARTRTAITRWWTIGEEGFLDAPRRSDCP
jgi:ABC-type branched-subunit amino acid transport system substrate-binding protein